MHGLLDWCFNILVNRKKKWDTALAILIFSFLHLFWWFCLESGVGSPLIWDLPDTLLCSYFLEFHAPPFDLFRSISVPISRYVHDQASVFHLSHFQIYNDVLPVHTPGGVSITLCQLLWNDYFVFVLYIDFKHALWLNWI